MNFNEGWTEVVSYTAQELALLEPCEFERWNGAGLIYKQDFSRIFYVTASTIIFTVEGYIERSAVMVNRETGFVTVHQPSGQETPSDKNVTVLLPFLVSQELIDGKLNLSELKTNAIVVFLPDGYTWPWTGWDLC